MHTEDLHLCNLVRKPHPHRVASAILELCSCRRTLPQLELEVTSVFP